ncbi:unnamed protein product [Closterium sp. NIES-64]|nr:unnamed protein product [Closterium sp. NIES-64]
MTCNDLRVEGVLLMTCEDENRIAALRSAVGSRIRLEAGVEGVKVITGAAVDQRSSLTPSHHSVPFNPPSPLPRLYLNLCSLEAGVEGVKVITGAAVDQRSSSSSSSSADAAGSGSSKSEDEVWVQALKPQPVRVQEARLPVLPLHEAQLATCGAKAHACAKLEELSIASTFAGADFSVPRFAVITFGVMDASTAAHSSTASSPPSTLSFFLLHSPVPPAFPGADFSVPRSAVITFGVMEEAITASNRRTLFHRLVATLDDPNLQGSVLDSTCAQIRTLLEESPLPPRLLPNPLLYLLRKTLALSPRLANSSSGSGSGSNGKATGSASTSAVAPGSSAPSDFLSAEVAPGLGETLASGTRGTAWRFAVGKSDGSVRILAFANFSEKIVMAPVAAGGGSGGRNTGAGSGGGGGVVMQAVDYSGQLLSTSPDAQVVLAKKLEAVGAFLEDRFVTPPIVTTAASSAAAAAMAAGGSSAVTIASSWFTLCTAAVIPLYTLMIFAPDWHVTEKIMSSSLPSILLAFTEKIMSSSLPSILLGFVYLYLLYKSWTPNTLLYMFSSKYWLPEYWLPEVRLYQSPLYELLNSSRALPCCSIRWPAALHALLKLLAARASGHHSDLAGITQMFASTLTVASAWIHLLAVDLFAARHVYLDGLKEKLETRHSLVLCLMLRPLILLIPSSPLLPHRHVYLDGLKQKLETRHSLVLWPHVWPSGHRRSLPHQNHCADLSPLQEKS